MKIKFTVFIFSFCIVSTLFSQKVLLLNSLFTEHDAVLVPQMEGDWNIIDFDMTVSIHKVGDNFYFLKYGSEKKLSTFEAAFVKINNEYFMDISGIMPDSIGDKDFRNSFIRSHTIYKVQLTKDTLELSELSYAWFYDYAMKRKLPLKYEWIDNAMLLTMKTDELNSFFAGQKDEKGFFENPIVLTMKSSSIKTEKNTTENISENKITEIISQICFPEFPFKDGWLGGDGDVSIPINKTQTLFIFSDTYVGNKNQQSRLEPGMKMVSNTVAVETCLLDGKTDVHYFWNNMYADNPESIFKSFTNRYHYWVNDAFMYKTSLYVVLQKVSQKQGAAPDDFFGFSLPGFTLAKITNPLEPPVNWEIELNPLPDFAYPLMGIHCHVIQDNFLYFFVSLNGNDNAQFLVRKKLDPIDNYEKHFEYYAMNRTWKTGMVADDMDTVINGFRANTVNYHPDIKQWVMVCDIKFMENKINIRTSPLLTGPWSEEKIVYEIPEVTPGTISYNKSNFCYLSRECIQNYDPKTHMMLITYDINNSSFSEINSNPKIYTPKVIIVSLKKYGSR
jgi:hypothetical protein